jgi:hypothetical protein
VACWSPDERFGLVPEPLLKLLDVVLPDFQQPTVIEVLVGFEACRGVLWFSEPGVSGRTGFRLSAEGETEGLVQIADWLQEQFFIESIGAWGEARPACPGHQHPARAEQIDGEAWWVCPSDSHKIAPIGRFAEERG